MSKIQRFWKLKLICMRGAILKFCVFQHVQKVQQPEGEPCLISFAVSAKISSHPPPPSRIKWWLPNTGACWAHGLCTYFPSISIWGKVSYMQQSCYQKGYVQAAVHHLIIYIYQQSTFFSKSAGVAIRWGWTIRGDGKFFWNWCYKISIFACRGLFKL